MPTWLYVALCLAVPSTWGLVMHYTFSLWERRTVPLDGRKRRPPVDYSI